MPVHPGPDSPSGPLRALAAAAVGGLVLGWGLLGALWPAPWSRPHGAWGATRLPGALAVGLITGLAAYGIVVLLPRLRTNAGRRSRERLAQRSARFGAPPRAPAPGNATLPVGDSPPVAAPPGSEVGPAILRSSPGAKRTAGPPDSHGVARNVAFGARWNPEHVHVGRTVSTRYLGPDARFYRTWLVYDEEGSLLGGAGMRARQRDGEAEMLEVWFFERDEGASPADPPLLVLATPEASGDVVETSDGAEIPVIAAVTGLRFSLSTAGLALHGVVVEAIPDASGLAFRTLTVDLCATPKEGADL